jgi:hypothetical protein
MTSRLAGALILVTVSGVLLVPAAEAAVPTAYQNCTNLQKTYPHGIGRATARDKTSGKPVTTFRKDTAGYNKAMKYNKGLDRDKDGIACEKR